MFKNLKITYKFSFITQRLKNVRYLLMEALTKKTWCKNTKRGLTCTHLMTFALIYSVKSVYYSRICMALQFVTVMLALCLCPIHSMSAKTRSVSGVVTDSITGERLPFASLICESNHKENREAIMKGLSHIILPHKMMFGKWTIQATIKPYCSSGIMTLFWM